MNGRKKNKNIPSRLRIGITVLGTVLGGVLIYVFLLHGKGAAAAWWNDGWKYRKTVTISNSTTDRTDYQTLITMDTATLVAAGKLQSDCDDIRVIGQDGGQYNYWIEPTSCNTSTTKIWVKITSISSTGTDMYIYYGNVSASSISKAATDIFMQEVSNVGAGWLLDETSANSCTGGSNDSCDSSGGDYDLAWGTATSNTTGKINSGLNFDGTDNATANIDNTFAPITSTKRWTVALWFKTSDTDGYLFDTGDAANIGDRVAVFTDGANNLSLYMSSNTNGTEYKYLNYSVTSTDNNWHHLVVTRDGDNSVKLYVDATPISVSFTTTNVDMTSYTETWADFHLGHRYFLNIYNYTGVIDEARVYSASLTPGEISALYGDGSNRHGYVTANYPGKELIRQYSSNVSVGSLGQEEVGPGPIAYWKFDEGSGTSVQDLSGNEHTGTLGTGSSAPTWRSAESCVNGNCLEFDGTSDYISAGDSLDFTGNTEMTVSAWIKLTSTPSSRGQIISKYDSGTSGQWYFGVDGQKKVVFLRECGSYGITGNNALSLSTWNHVTGVYDGTDLKIYVNGILDETAPDSCSISDTSVDMVIGAGDNGTGVEDYFPGFIDELKVYPYARTADEIKQDYLFSSAQGASVVLGAKDTSFLSNGLVGYWKMDETTGTTGPSWTAVDSSGNGNDGTGAGNAVVSTGKFGNGGEFDGNGDYLNMGDQTEHDLTFPFTLSSWINLSQLPSDKGSDAEIMSKYGGSGTRQWTLSIGTDNVLYFFKSHNGTNGEYGVVSGHEFTSADVGAWRHVTYSVDSQGNAKMYIDGELVESYAFTNLTIYTGASTSMRIGARALNSNYFKGSIDEARIYNRSLSPGEVKSLSQWAPGPVVYYDLNENSGTTSVSDKSGNGNTGSMSGFAGTDWKTGKYGSSLNFDETDNYLELANNSTIQDLSSGDFTTSFWLKTVQAGGYSTGIIATKFACFPAGDGWNIYLDRQNLVIGIVNEFGTTDASYVSASDSIPSDEWAHVSVVWRGEGRTADIYVDGVEVSYNTQTAGVGTLGSDASLPLRVGRHNGCSNYLDGQLDEFRIYNYARTQSQIIEDMNAGHPLGGSPIGSQLAYWKMDEGYGDLAHDSIGSSDAWLAAGDVCPGDSECPTWTNDGKFGKALSFDGGDIMEAEMISGYDNNGSDPYTGTLWFKSDTNPTNNYALMGIVSNSGGNQDRFIQVTSSGVPRFYVYDGQERYATGTTDVIDGTWHHLAGVFDGTTIYIYVDGKLEASAATTGSENHTNPYVRFSHQVTSYYNHTVGTIDEAKIYAAALTKEQVLLDMNQGKSMVLGAQSTGVGGTTPSNASGRAYCIPGDSTSCTSPVFEMNLDENTGTVAYDTSTNGNDGSIMNGAKWRQSSQCKSTSCIEFDGSDDYIGLSDDSVLNFSGGSFTAETWVKFKSLPSVVDRQFIILNKATDSGDSTSRGWQLRASKYTDGLSFRVWPSTGQPDVAEVVSNGTITLDTWYHVAAVYDGSADTAAMYVNGVLQQNTASGITATDYATDLTLGAYTGGAGTHELDGYMDQVKIYDYARTPAQIAWDMNKGAPIVQYRFDECQGTTVHDVTGNGYNATMSIGGNETTSAGTCNSSNTSWGNGASGKWNASLDLDGADDYLSTGSTVPSLAGISEMSVCSWIKYEPASVTADGVIVGQYSGSPPGWLLWVDDVGAVFGETDTVSFSPNPVGGSAGRVEGTTGLVSTGIWDHYCGVFKGGSFIRLYKNGALNAENTSSIVSVTDVPDTALQIGRWTNFNNSYFDGQIDDIRIYNYALTGHQIKEVYRGGAVSFK